MAATASQAAFVPEAASDVTMVITACGRPALLHRTLSSFLAHNEEPLHAILVAEDSGIAGVNDAVAAEFPTVTFLPFRAHGGQAKSVDELYAAVRTKYVLGWEEDWETTRGGFIGASRAILDSTPSVSVVLLGDTTDERTPYTHGASCVGPADGPAVPRSVVFRDAGMEPFGWGGFSFNPGLRRTDDLRAHFPRGLEVDAPWYPHCKWWTEIVVSRAFRAAGMRLALTDEPRGFVRHIG